MDWMTLCLALCMGLSLSAACGLRVFMPLFALAVAVRWGGLPVTDSLAWVQEDAALICLGSAMLIELLGYYIPFVDNVLDTVQTPLALAAGVCVMGGMMDGLPDYLQWGVGAIGGAGAAGGVKLATNALRLASSATTGGAGNGILATLENILAVVGTVLAIIVPVLALLGLVVLIAIAWYVVNRLSRRRAAASAAAEP